MKKIVSFVLLITLYGLSSPVNAELWVDQTRGLVYDTDLDITWLQDAQYAITSNYDSDGLMTWDESLTWASQLSYQGYDDWRLPETVPSTEKFFQTGSEMGHLYYEELGNDAYYYGFHDAGPFLNLNITGDVNSSWWSGTPVSGDPNAAWLFNWFTGAQDEHYIGASAYAWAVREGNSGISSSVVPEPISSILFAIGGSFLAGRRYIKRKKRRITTCT